MISSKSSDHQLDLGPTVLLYETDMREASAAKAEEGADPLAPRGSPGGLCCLKGIGDHHCV